ncbi:MAG TPA: phospholipid carrier-dependent glycosyltransferase [Candidatus Binataceae bacterium]|nr:phospholipid carrier-dependent glycosyltransferase [Candidatus Binataceae bacterium]
MARASARERRVPNAHKKEKLASSLTPAATVPTWSRIDTIAIVALTIVAAALRLWHLGYPPGPVFDEINFVGDAGAYLRREQFFTPHPPLTIQLIALGMWLFGDHTWSWRLSNALVGTALVAITYLLGRRLFQSRLAAALAAAFVALDGMFLIDSRTGVLDIVYITTAALAYLLLFRFAQIRGPADRRRTLVFLAVALGLCLGAKLMVPIIAVILVSGSLIYVLETEQRIGTKRRERHRKVIAALLLTGSISAIVYFLVFVPNFIALRWGGIEAWWRYVNATRWFEAHMNAGEKTFWSDGRASPWWNWPLMLHPFIYWQRSMPDGAVATVWFAPNPILCWAALGAIFVTILRLFRSPTFTDGFVVAGYIGFLAIYMPVSRTLYEYHYMPALYFGYLALAGILARCWRSATTGFEQLIMLLALVPAAELGFGFVGGSIALAALFAAWGVSLRRFALSGRFACVSCATAAFAAFIYFAPLYFAMPISPAGFHSRMWMQGPGTADWSCCPVK